MSFPDRGDDPASHPAWTPSIRARWEKAGKSPKNEELETLDAESGPQGDSEQLANGGRIKR